MAFSPPSPLYYRGSSFSLFFFSTFALYDKKSNGKILSFQLFFVILQPTKPVSDGGRVKDIDGIQRLNNYVTYSMTLRTRQEYIEILKNHADVLKTNYGISYMRLFGSVAKNEHHGDSDIDLLVVMPAKAYMLCAAADYLESILGTSVDLIRKHDNMRPFFLNQINKYGIDIFGQA